MRHQEGLGLKTLISCCSIALLQWLILMQCANASPSTPQEVNFSTDFLYGAVGQQVDISRFSRGNPVLPGEYDVGVQVNDKWIGHFYVEFVAQPHSDIALPCIDRRLIEQIGLDYEKLPPIGLEALAKIKNGGCAELDQIIAGASMSFDQHSLLLVMRIPQSVLRRNPRGYVNPELWDEGVTSGTLAYNLNAYRSTSAGRTANSAYIGLTGGLNLGTWHFRQRSSLTSSPNGSKNFQNIATYLMHDIPSLRSSFVAGDSYTDGSIFNSFGFRGVAMATNDRMLPDSMRGYAPVVRGVARSNARVRVTQNGNLLLETTVPPGTFEINDLYPTGYGGDIVATVYEADGTQQTFTVPYASVPQLLRPGIWRYSAVAGEVRDGQTLTGERIFQGAVQHGVNNLLTAYTGVIASTNYKAVLVGTAFNTPLGALAVDLTQANANIPGAKAERGQSLRLSYAKFMTETNTSISLAAYRYSSEGYWSLRDTISAQRSFVSGLDVNSINRQKSQLQFNISQPLGGRWGSLYLTGSSVSYWNQPGNQIQYQAGYSNYIPIAGVNVGYNISFSKQRNILTGTMDSQVMLSLSFPLGRSARAPMVTGSYNDSIISGVHQRTSQEQLTGVIGEDNALTYSASALQSSNGKSVALGGQYRGNFSTLSAGFSQGSEYSQGSFGAMGTVIWHPKGVSFANQTGETMAVIEAHGAEGTRVINNAGTRIDGQGFAALPLLVPYRINTVSLDPEGISQNVEFAYTSQQIAPRANTVSMIHFKTNTGRAVLFNAHLPNGEPVPFSAGVFDDDDSEVGLVGQHGRVFARGIEDKGVLIVRWGSSLKNQCSFEYELPEIQTEGSSLLQIDVICQKPQ